ncbi:hypothetical protein [Streptomyces sp. NPDC060198]|uniref:hypothetical protein n=1 Tax=Streptomyces sp. NPDC060198 TaxID=3347070 RepID=UPI00365D0B71
MHSQPRPAAPRGFHCEHTPGGSRVLALVDHDAGPSSLRAVLTCRSPELAHEAARLLQRALFVPADAWDAGPLEDLCGRLPKGAADALRTAAGRALAGAWPSGEGGAPEWDRVPPEAPSAAPAPGAPSARGRGRDGDGRSPRAPGGARLAGLAGPVFRIALLREFHVHDPEALLDAAADEGWEPLPADRLGSHDPQDLIGAALWLAERGGAMAGADTLADRSQAYRLAVEEGDEVAGWSREEVVADFGSGWLGRAKAQRPGEPVREAERPDFASLFEVDAPHCADPECGEERCQWQLTARTAAALHEALRLLAGHALDHAEALGDRPLAPGGRGEGAGVFTRLPRVTFGVGAAWRRRFVRAVEDVASDLEHGWWPEPTCTAEELALHLAIEDARAAEEPWAVPEGRGATGLSGGAVPPAHRDDHDFDGCAEMFFQDTDVLMLYDAGLDGVEDPEDEANQRLGIGDLRPSAWFAPFLNVTPREAEPEHGGGGEPEGGYGSEGGYGAGPEGGTSH